MDSRSMRDCIRNFSLNNCPHGNQGYSQVLIQLFGYTGHGKSSIINFFKYVIDDGPYKVYAKVAGSEDKPETMIRKSYELTNTITLVDNRGCVKMNKDETGEIYIQLGHFLPLGCAVEWHSGFKDIMEKLLTAELMDNSPYFIVPVLIYSAKRQITPTDEQELKEILIKAKSITGTSKDKLEAIQRLMRLLEMVETGEACDAGGNFCAYVLSCVGCIGTRVGVGIGECYDGRCDVCCGAGVDIGDGNKVDDDGFGGIHLSELVPAWEFDSCFCFWVA